MQSTLEEEHGVKNKRKPFVLQIAMRIQKIQQNSIVSTVLSATIALLSLVIVGLMVVMWNHRGRAQYQTIN